VISRISLTLLLALISTDCFAQSDLFFSKQWSLHNDGSQTIEIDSDHFHVTQQKSLAGFDIGWLEAQPLIQAHTLSSVIVAVIDSGVDSEHPDLQGRISKDGYDFINKTSNMTDPEGHGTHVSGIIAANTDNKIGIAGIAPSSITILPLTVLSPQYGTGFSVNGTLISDYAAMAVRYAVAHHASVINLSLGWPKVVDTANARAAFQEAVNAGVAVIVSAGNDRKGNPTFPCAYEGVICVGAVSNNGESTLFSNYGGLVDVVAPGDGILSLYSTHVESKKFRIQGYEILEGTSQSAPEVTAIAATLRSIYPDISLNELHSRILSSSKPYLTPHASLYGVANLAAAIDAKPKAVYLPDFKSMGEAVVDENTLQIHGSLGVKNLWLNGSQVRTQVLVNGVLAGSGFSEELSMGSTLNTAWSYHFSSLDESSDLKIEMKVTDQSGVVHEFTHQLVVVRAMKNFPVQTLSNLEKGSDWIGTNIYGTPYSKSNQIPIYGADHGVPSYFQSLSASPAGYTIRIFNPSNSSVKTVLIPQIQNVVQVVQADVNLDGKLDWVITGDFYDNHQQLMFQFLFLDDSFQPLYGDMAHSAWVAPFANGMASSFAIPGSWIRDGDRLIPCFVATGLLPPTENFDQLDPRQRQFIHHFYYLKPGSPNASKTATSLELHALDNAAFRQKFPAMVVQNLVFPSATDQLQGHLSLLFAENDDFNAQNYTWKLDSISDATKGDSITPIQGWDSSTARGNPNPVMTRGQSTSVFFNVIDPIDSNRASLTWSSTNGDLLARDDFSFFSPENALQAYIGAFDLGNVGHYWFMQSVFDLIAYHSLPGSAPTTQILPLERDSSFQYSQFKEMSLAVLMGSVANPIPAIYIDSTLVNGNRISIATIDPSTNSFSKRLRDSIQIPADCLQVAPFHVTSDPSSLVLPLFCKKGTSVDFDLVPFQ